MKAAFFVFFLSFLGISSASLGDRHPTYQKCLKNCQIENCTDDGMLYRFSNQQSLPQKVLLWTCKDECIYDCMWKTVDYFHEKGLKTPQFHGKWPFIRFLGIQEPASVVFSLLNLYAHLKLIRKFQKEVRPDSPLYWLWHIFALVCTHAWVWSSIFHMRDMPLTEFMDYACAFSVILVNCYVMFVRVTKNYLPKFFLVIVSVFFAAFFLNHAIYLSGMFSYKYNMELNLMVGTFTAIWWFSWAVYHRNRQPYVKKIAIYTALTGLVLLLEVMDHPPFLWVFDSHSLWHLATAPLLILIYSFAIDDCKYLRQKKVESIVKSKLDNLESEKATKNKSS